MTVTVNLRAAGGATVTRTLADPVVVQGTLAAVNVTATTANLAWTPSGATVTSVGRDGVDSNGNGPWSGVPSQLPFTSLVPNTTYTLFAVVNGVRLETVITTLPATTNGSHPLPFVTPAVLGA